jgi:hypothetical protein
VHEPQFGRSCGKSATADLESLSYVSHTNDKVLESVTGRLRTGSCLDVARDVSR